MHNRKRLISQVPTVLYQDYHLWVPIISFRLNFIQFQTSLVAFSFLAIFPTELNTDVVDIDLLNAEVKGGRALCKGVVVGCRVHEEGVLPQRPGVVAGGLPLEPVELVGELGGRIT